MPRRPDNPTLRAEMVGWIDTRIEQLHSPIARIVPGFP
jgi:hypothetical protein